MMEQAGFDMDFVDMQDVGHHGWRGDAMGGMNADMMGAMLPPWVA